MQFKNQMDAIQKFNIKNLFFILWHQSKKTFSLSNLKALLIKYISAFPNSSSKELF